MEEDAVRTAPFTEYDGEIGLSDDENYVVYAKLTDHAGNVTIIGSDGFAIDTIAPEIVGYQDGETVNACGNLTLTFKDANLKEVTYTVFWSSTPRKADLVDGKYTLSGSNGEQVITATDKVGNTTTVTFDVRWNHDFNLDTKKCNHCGQNALVEQTIDGVTELYDSYDKAISALNNAPGYESTELKLLGDINKGSSSIVWGGSKRVFNLNGHTFSIKPNESEKNGEFHLSNSIDITIVGGGILDADCYLLRGGALTVDNAGGKITKLAQSSGTLKILSGTIDELEIAGSRYETVTERTTELCGGSYGSIKIGFEGLTCADLLKKGYCYKGVKYVDAKVTALSNAEVVRCEHKDIQADGYCPDCGQTIKATVEFDGEIQMFKTLESAITFAEQNEGSVIKLAVDITLDRTTSLLENTSINLTEGTYTIDLNGKTLKFEKDPNASEPLSQLKIAGDCHLTIADSVGGGKVTTGTEANTAAAIYIDSHLTVTGGDFTAIEDFTVGYGSRGKLTLSGGSFRKICTHASRTSELKDPMDFLAEGYSYKIGDRFATSDDVKFIGNDPEAGIHYYTKYIENVSVVPTPVLKFDFCSLKAESNLTLNFKFDTDNLDNGYFTDVYAVFTIGGKTITVDGDKMDTDWEDPDNTLYVFSLEDIDPNQMTETVTAQLFGKHNGEDVQSEITSITIADYCLKLLETNKDDAKLQKLVVDMLNYGAAAQNYTNRNTDNLANSGLTDEQKALGTAADPELTSITNTNYKTIENPTVNWKGAAVTLKNAISLRFAFTADDIDGLSVKISSTGIYKEFTADEFIKGNGYYYVVIDGFPATKLSDEVFVTVYNEDEAVSNTLRYSVESYAYAKQNSADTDLANLVKALMKYGNSAKEYSHGRVG